MAEPARRRIVIRKPLPQQPQVQDDTPTPPQEAPPPPKPRRRIIKQKPREQETIQQQQSPKSFDSDDAIMAAHLSNDYIINALIDKSPSRLIKAIYNQHKCIRNIGMGTFQVYLNGEWQTHPTRQLLTDLTETAYRLFKKQYNDNPELILELCERRNIDCDMCAIEQWLEDLWDQALPNMADIHSSMIQAL